MIFVINVAKKYIREGVPCECELCPLVMAIVDQVDFVASAQVSIDGVWLYDDFPKVIAECSLPVNAVKFMDAFDNGKPVQPFSFELEIIQKQEKN